MKKRVFIHAYMAGNLGDDLMVWILCRRYEDVKFCVLADQSYKARFRQLENLRVYAPQDKVVSWWNQFWKKSKNIDDGFRKMLIKTSMAVVHIGGSVFVQHFDDYSMFYNTDVNLRRLSKRMYVIGANFGPYTDENYFRQYYELLQKYDGVCFRDSYSYTLFKDLANIEYAPDVVFNYQPVMQNSVTAEKRQVLISVIQCKGRDDKFPISQFDDIYKKFLIDITEEYINKGYFVKFVSFCPMQGDTQAAIEIRAALSDEKKKQTEIYTYEHDIEQCACLFDESEIIIGTRFHSIILGWLKKKKVLPIIYDLKTLRTLEDNNCMVYVKLDELENVNIETLMEKIEKLPEINLDKKSLDRIVGDAEKQFFALDKLLK